MYTVVHRFVGNNQSTRERQRNTTIVPVFFYFFRFAFIPLCDYVLFHRPLIGFDIGNGLFLTEWLTVIWFVSSWLNFGLPEIVGVVRQILIEVGLQGTGD